MTKKTSKCLFVIFSIILVLCLVATFVNFTYPLTINGNYYSYSSFISNLRLGEDVGSSLRFVYRTNAKELNLSASELQKFEISTMNGLKDILKAQGYQNVTVSSAEDNHIVLNVGDLLEKSDEETIKNLIGDPQTLSFSTSSKVEDAIIFVKDIDKVEPNQYYNRETGETSYYVLVTFKDKDKIAELTADLTSIYIMLGDTAYTTNGMTIGEGGITDGYIAINGGFENMDQATSFANKIKSGMLDLALTCERSVKITPSYGIGAGLWVSIGLVALVIIAFVALIVKYRHLGWLASYNLLFFVVIGLLLLQSIPLVSLNLAGIVGLGLGFIVAADSLLVIIERAKRYYNSDTKFNIALKASQKDSLMRIILNNLVLLLVGFVCVFMPVAAVKSFGWTMLVLSLVSVFTSLVMMRLFIKMYLPFNKDDGKKCNFHKGGENA